jgi:pullulanase/glycogen debranching enzyme
MQQCKFYKRAIAVVLDMVLNHAFGQSPMVQMYLEVANNRSVAYSLWFNIIPTHLFNVGYDLNHESVATETYSKNVLKYWQLEFKIDGFRFDLSKGFAQTNNLNNVNVWIAHDASTIAIWKDYYNAIKQQDSTFFTILEHFADNIEEKELSDFGLMF